MMYEMYDDRPYSEDELAGLFKRWLGQVLDNVLPMLALGCTVFIAALSGSDILPIIVGSMGGIGIILYILFADGMNEGQSWGKKIVGTRVIDMRTGDPCTYGQSFVRNIFYLLGFFDWIFIFGARRQRLGDIVAGTVVIEA